MTALSPICLTLCDCSQIERLTKLPVVMPSLPSTRSPALLFSLVFFLLRVTAHPRSIPLILLHHSYHTELDMLYLYHLLLQSRLPIPLIARQRVVSGLNQPFLAQQWWRKVQYSAEKWQRTRRQSVSIMRAGESQGGGSSTIWYSRVGFTALLHISTSGAL